jgi:hypothetical protein
MSGQWHFRSLASALYIRPQGGSAQGESSALQGPGPTVMVALQVMPLTVSVAVTG